MASCDHLTARSSTVPDARTPGGCEECIAAGTRWVHLRLCVDCGHVGCCDSSPMRHATAHHRSTAHPVVMSHEPGEDWRWCYEDRVQG